jgi:hypothetical protein
MKIIRVLLSFIRYSVPVKIEFYRKVVACLTANVATFAKPDVDLTVVNTTLTNLTSAFQAAESGLKEAKPKMKKFRDEADDQFRLLAKYVDRIANGDEAIIRNAGFLPTKQPTAASRPKLSAKNGETTGEIILRCKTYPNARSYVWKYCTPAIPEKEEGWQYAGTTTKTTITIGNLTPLAKYWFKVAPVTAEGTQAWLNPVMKVVI